MSRTIFIGDVHGCSEELAELLAVLQPSPGKDRVIFVGDLVDKGPDSLGVLDIARRLLRTLPGSVVVSGNHEEKALRDIKRGIYKEPWMSEATPEDLAFMESMPLFWWDGIPAAKGGITVVHGGIFPALLNNHPDVFLKIRARGDKWRKGGGKVMNRARRMLRIRYVGGAVRMETGEKPGPGDMLELGANREGDPFWADSYDGSQGFVVYGHSPWQDGKVKWNEHAAGIDTAAVFGAKLTALVLEPGATVCDRPGPAPTIGGVPYQLVSVDARKQYAEPMFGDGD
jgi:hypothetical protein